MPFVYILLPDDEAAHCCTAAGSEVRFQDTFEKAPLGIAHVSPDGKWLRVNERLSDILGYSADEFAHHTVQDFTHPDDLAASTARLSQLCQGEIKRIDTDKRYLHKDGMIVWVRLTVSRICKSDGSIDYSIAIIDDISARKCVEGELRKTEERFRSALLQSPAPIMVFDHQEKILAVSQSWLEASGYSREELSRIEDWTARAYHERSDKVLEYIRWIISTGPAMQQNQLVIRTKDGQERLWRFIASALGNQSDGGRIFICAACDITERKTREEQVRLLLREVTHRAKNIFGIVQTIARQTATRGHEDFVERFVKRIQALAASQDLLIRNEWEGVDLDDLVRAQIEHFAGPPGARMAVGGPCVRLNPAAAQAIGLTLHELATNATKYGALSVENGRIDVRWHLDSDNFVMSWTESNGPAVRPPERHGFGSTIIEAMAKITLGGQAQLDYTSSGLIWRLTCPTTHALDRR